MLEADLCYKKKENQSTVSVIGFVEEDCSFK